jgi:alcohol dehydrogenase
VTICGTDLHILKGDVPAVTDGRILGHEAVGTVQEIGSGVTTIRPGDRVLVSCITACGRCRFRRGGRYGLCTGGGGWILGHLIDGTQAEYVRVPFADTSTHPSPDEVADEAVLMLADIGPTGYEVGVLNGAVRPGDTVVVVGAGPVGLATILTARLFSPRRIVAIDVADSRLEAAEQFGAGMVLNNSHEDPHGIIKRITGGWVQTSQSRRSEFRRPSSCARARSVPEGMWRTWESTESTERRQHFTSRICGSRA